MNTRLMILLAFMNAAAFASQNQRGAAKPALEALARWRPDRRSPQWDFRQGSYCGFQHRRPRSYF